MRNWKFLLTSQILRGAWFINPDHAIAAGADLELLFSPTIGLESLTKDLLETRGPYSFTASSSNGDESSVFNDMPEGSIAVFKMSGTLLKYGTWCTYGTEEIGQFMQQAAVHKNIAGALIEQDSGGGAVNAISPLIEGRMAFKRMGKPTLTLADACYSAAYYDASASDYIMASNAISAGFGSIGVMMGLVNMKAYYEKLGIVVKNLYAPESSEKNKAFELAMEGKYEMIQTEELSPLAVGFQNAVKVNRAGKLKMDEGEKVLKGKTYSAERALELGLIDGIGNRQDAVNKLFDLIEIRKFLKSK